MKCTSALSPGNKQTWRCCPQPPLCFCRVRGPSQNRPWCQPPSSLGWWASRSIPATQRKGAGGGLKVWQFIAWVLLTWTRTVITQSADLQTGLHKWHTLLLNTSKMLTWSHLHSPTSCTQRALYSNNINLSLTLVLAFRAAFSSSGFVQSAKDTSRPTVLATFWK